MIHHRRRLTRQPRKVALLITLAIQIGQKIIIQSLPIRVREPSLGLKISVSKIMAHATMQKVETGRVVFRLAASVVAPVEGRWVFYFFRRKEGGQGDGEEEFVGGDHIRGESGHGGELDDVGGEIDGVGGGTADVGAAGGYELEGEVRGGGEGGVGLEDFEDIGGGVRWGVGDGWWVLGNNSGAGDAGE